MVTTPRPHEITALLARRSGSPALITGRDAWSYSEVADAADHIAAGLCGIGIGPGMRVGLMLGNVPDFVCSFLAVTSIGASAVLLSTYFREREVGQYCRGLGLRTVLTWEECEKPLAAIAGPVRRHETITPACLPKLRCFGIPLSEEVNPAPGPADELVVQFTSGVGGISKMVGRGCANIADEIHHYCADVDLVENDRILALTPLFHAYGLVNGLLPAFYRGACLILPERFIPRQSLALAEEHGASIVLGVPLMYEVWSQIEPAPTAALATTRYCFSAGGKLHRQTLDRFPKKYGVNISQLYGSTETGIIAFNRAADAASRPDTVGRPVGGLEIQLADEDGILDPARTEGEIVIRSRATAPFYIDAPNLTAAAFRDGWYFTGDLGDVDSNGLLRITGRKSTFINVGGMKVDPFEVEDVIGAIPGVREVAVVGRPRDDSFGSDVVRAYVVCDRPTPRHTIQAQCREKIAEYKVPREIEFVDALPRNPMGKILRKYLKPDSHEGAQ